MIEALPNSLVEAMSEKERDQIETTLGDAEHLAKIIKNYLKVVDYCNDIKCRFQTEGRYTTLDTEKKAVHWQIL